MAAPQPRNLQFYANAYPDGTLGADADGIVTVINDRAARMLEVEMCDAIGSPLADVLRLQDHQGRSWLDYNRPFDSLNIRTGVPEQSWVLPNGREALVTARLVRPAPLAPLLGLGIGLRDGRGRARLDRERSDLVATVAHELRSPLTGVKGFVQALLSRWDKLSEAQKKMMLHTVSSDADRLARLIAELLDVARLDTGRLSVYPRPCEAEQLVQRAVASVTAGTSRPIVTRYEPGVPDVAADPDKFIQVVTNLLENGVRHGAGMILVSVCTDDEFVRITVDDEGDGIPPEVRQRIFTKFWTLGAGGGSGLGMYIVNGLVRAHGGHVDIDDAPGGGARVVVAWPRAKDV